jgi:hypothetical protein
MGSPSLYICCFVFELLILKIQDVDFSLEDNLLLKTGLRSDLEMPFLKVSFL